MSDNVISYKFKVGEYYQAPNICIGCGTTDNGNTEGKSFGMVDLGRDIDWYGVCYICYNCIRELAAVAGLISPGDYEDIANRLASRELQVTQLTVENEHLRRIVDGYSSLSLSNFGHDDSDGTDLEDTPSLGEETSPDESEDISSDGDKLPEEASGGTNDEESRTDELSSVEESSDVLSTSSDDDSDSKFLDELDE